MLRPTNDVEILEARMARIEYFTQHLTVQQDLAHALKGVKDIAKMFDKRNCFKLPETSWSLLFLGYLVLSID